MKFISAYFLFLLLVPSQCSFADRSRDLEKRVITTASQRIEIKGLSGSEITFKSWDKNEISIKLSVRISASDEKYEEDYVNALDIEETRSPSSVTVNFKELQRGVRGSGSFWGLFKGSAYLRKEIVGEIYVPKSNPLTTDLSYGSITLDDMKGEVYLLGKNNSLSLKNCSSLQTIENDYGTTVVENSGGSLNLSGVSSKVTIEKFEGPVKISADYSSLKLKDLKQSVSIRSQSGKHTIENVGGNLTVRSNYSTIVVNNVSGMAEIHSQSGNLRIENVDGLIIEAPYTKIEARRVTGKASKEVSIRGQSDSITLEDVQGNVTLDCPYSPISLEKVRGSVTLVTQSGRVTADDVIGDWKSETDYSTVRIRGLKAKSVSIRTKSNPVELDLLSIPATLDILNEYGSVAVSMPKGFSGEIQLDSEYASIDTDFPLRVKKTGGSAYAVGKVGTGSGTITIETKSGNITLKQRE